MSSKLQGTSLIINDTQEIAKIKTSVNNVEDEVPTSKAVKNLIDSLIPVTLEVEGDWTNKQVRYRIPDPEGLSFKAIYKNGNTAYVGAQLVSPEAWPDTGLQTATFSYTENDITIYGTRSIGIELLPVSLSVSGNWTNYQYAGLAPDPTGLTFTVTYDDDSTATFQGLSVIPTIWGNTVGTQTATFSYSQVVGNKTVTVSVTKNATVVRKPISLTVTEDWSRPQFYNNPPDPTGLKFTVGYSNNTSEIVSVSNIDISPDVWGGKGTQTATFSYTENGATVEATRTANVVRKPDYLDIESGNLSDNYQYTNTAPNISSIHFKVYYNDGTNKTVSNITVAPNSWSSTAGQQTATFSYTENGIVVSINRNATVVRKLSSLSVGGSWTNRQVKDSAPNTAGLTFTANYNNGTTATITPSVSPSTWSGTGTQTATFSYTENGITVSATKTATVYIVKNITIGSSYGSGDLYPTHWRESDVSFDSLSANSMTTARSSSYGSTTVARMCRCTDTSTVTVTNDQQKVIYDDEGSVSDSYYYKFQDYVLANNTGTWTVPESGTYRICVRPTSTYIFGTKNSCWAYRNGTMIISSGAKGSIDDARTWAYTDITLKKGDSITWTADVGYGGSENDKGYLAVFVQNCTLYTAGMTSTGSWWEDSSRDWHKLGSSYVSKDTRLLLQYRKGSFWSYSTVTIFDSENNIKYLSLSPIRTVYMTDSDFLNETRYKAEGSLVHNGSTTATPSYVIKKSSSYPNGALADSSYIIALSEGNYVQVYGNLTITSEVY